MRSDRKGKRIATRRTDAKMQPTYDFTLREAFDFFVSLKRSENMRDRTISDYHAIMHEFVGWLGTDTVKATDITTQHIRDYIDYMRNQHVNQRTGEIGLAPGTVNIRLRVLKAMFGALFREYKIDYDPLTPVALLKVDEKPIKLPNDTEIDRLFKAMDKRQYADFRDYVMTALILDCGIRINELCLLEEDDIEFDTRSIRLPGTKSKNRKLRILPLSNTTMKLLRELITENNANWPDVSYVFLSDFGERYHPNSYRRRLMIYRDRAHIGKRVSPHLLRHQFATEYIMNGGDVFSLARIMGHADISTTKRYVNQTAADLRIQHDNFSPLVRIRTRYKERYQKNIRRNRA